MNKLSRAVRCALAGSALISGAASAQLADFGPSDPTVLWPQWYRDNNGLAVGLCKSQALSPNAAGATMCFPTTANPRGFAGNLGDEIFYNMVEVVQRGQAATGLNFRYLAALEASYLPGPTPVHGQETVFARVRIAINFNDPRFNGHYKVTHPFGVDEFDAEATTFGSVQGSQASVFYTHDVPLGVNFNEALGGMMGPFIKWDADVGADGFITVGADKFLGDPNIAHTFTGSPFTDADGHPQNYVRIDGPPGAGIGQDINGNPQDFIIYTDANVIGQVWTAPIAANLKIDHAVKARNATTGVNSIDVWASSTPAHKLVLTGVGMPSMQMLEDSIVKGHYHGHIEYPAGEAIPASVFVTDNTSAPIVSQTQALVDGVEVSHATYDTNTGDIDIVAQSTDEVSNPLPSLLVENIPGLLTAGATMTQAACLQTPFAASVGGFDKCFHYTLPPGIEPPKFINVRSSEGGSHDDQLAMVTGTKQNISPAPVQANVELAVDAPATSQLLLPPNSLIVTQPASGVIALVGGQYQFTANPLSKATADSFKFVVQDPNSGAVSNLATATLAITFAPRPPVGGADQFGGGPRNVARILNLVANDTAASDEPRDAINPASIVISTAPRNGAVVVGTGANGIPLGSIRYTQSINGAANGGTVDTFAYTIANSNTPTAQRTAPITIRVTNFAAAEALAYRAGFLPEYVVAKANYTARPTTTWFGPSLTPSFTCNLMQGTPLAVVAPLVTAPSPVPTDGTGLAQVLGTTTGVVPPATGASLRCTSSNGGAVTGAVTRK